MTSLSRRAFLAATAWLLPALRPRAFVPQPSTAALMSLDSFVELSERLVGRSNLDREIAQVYLTALVADAGTAVSLATLAHSTGNPTPEQSAVARTIIEWWYTGVYTIGKERRVATHSGALMWSALGRPAPGTCHGAFGAWSRPPAPIA